VSLESENQQLTQSAIVRRVEVWGEGLDCMSIPTRKLTFIWEGKINLSNHVGMDVRLQVIVLHLFSCWLSPIIKTLPDFIILYGFYFILIYNYKIRQFNKSTHETLKIYQYDDISTTWRSCDPCHSTSKKIQLHCDISNYFTHCKMTKECSNLFLWHEWVPPSRILLFSLP
jgi:hypothetical protein